MTFQEMFLSQYSVSTDNMAWLLPGYQTRRRVSTRKILLPIWTGVKKAYFWYEYKSNSIVGKQIL